MSKKLDKEMLSYAIEYKGKFALALASDVTTVQFCNLYKAIELAFSVLDKFPQEDVCILALTKPEVNSKKRMDNLTSLL